MLLRRGFAIIVTGLLLVILSIYPLFLLIRENILETTINSRYDFEQVINIRNQFDRPSDSTYTLSKPIIWEGNSIEVRTSDTGIEAPETVFDHFDKEPKHIIKITVLINGIESSSTEAWMPPIIQQDSDFLSWLNIVEVVDRKKNEKKVAIIRRISNGWTKSQIDYQKWTILYVDKDHQLVEEQFTYPERENHLLGVKLVQLSSQSSSYIGYKSDIAYLLPNLFFPLLYPAGTGLIGIILIVIGLFRAKRKR